MTQSLKNHVRNLKNALLELDAAGEHGFEGLIAEALREITGAPFRLASSGRQFGIDGKNAFNADCICFEGKRYDGKIPRPEIITKIADLARNNREADLIWILGATSPVSTQIADDARTDGGKNGISVLIYDWSISKTDIPPLAAVLTMGKQRVVNFLTSEISNKLTLSNALDAILAIQSTADFKQHELRIQSELATPAISISLAIEANKKWLTRAFSNKSIALSLWGQSLSPNDSALVKVLPRVTLVDKLKSVLLEPADGNVTFVLGNEGCGKSWIVAQSWSSLNSDQIMIVLSPDDFHENIQNNDFAKLLITKLLEQTGDLTTGENINRWQRRLSAWSIRTASAKPPLIVFIDGINQRPTIDWGAIINKLALYLADFGARILVSVRTIYFREYVERRIAYGKTDLIVPEWTSTERNEILNAYGIDPNILHVSVANSLLNPRLLGIALRLFNKHDMAAFSELSVSRLLFEHIRTGEQDATSYPSAIEFAKTLQQHAQTILTRVEQKQQDDLKVFEIDTPAVADGRFFQVVDGDPTKYELKDEGLTLALGFSIVDHLRKAKRNGRDLQDSLIILLEPIAALDDTANAVLAALTVILADDKKISPDIAISLIRGFVSLQNPDQTKYSAFLGLAKSNPDVFMEAAKILCLASMYQPNYNWVETALIEASFNANVWQKMVSHIEDWISIYNLSPQNITGPRFDDTNGQLQQQYDRKQLRIKERLNAFSSIESAFLKRLTLIDSDPTSLTSLSFFLMAGKPLKPFVNGLVDWHFAHAINPEYYIANKHLFHLISLNRVDWSETRIALHEASNQLRQEKISLTGKWALVAVLQSTGDSIDAKEARAIADGLNKEREHFLGGRLVESFCANDPCDPNSIKPNNIDETAVKYGAIDVAKLNLSMGHTIEDHFFDDARPGIARFEPSVAVAKHKELADDILTRSGFPLRQGVFELIDHNALLSTKQANTFISRWQEAKTSGILDGLSDQDRRIVAQYHLLIAFPLLSASERMNVFLSIEKDEYILADLMDLMLPVEMNEFDRLLNEIISIKDENKLYLLLVLAESTNTPLSESTCLYIASLIDSDSERVRTQALGITLNSNHDGMLKFLVQSNWEAKNTKTDDSYEEWYGSAALLKAATRNLIDHLAVVPRISPRIYGRAATLLNQDAKREIANRIDASIEQLAGLDSNQIAPDIEVEVFAINSKKPDHYSVSEKPISSEDFEETVKRFSENSQDFENRQKLNAEAFLDFKNKLTNANAHILLDNLKLNEFASIVEADNLIADKWFSLLSAISPSKLSTLHNIILLLAYSLSDKSPEKARVLHQKVENNKPIVRFTFGQSKIDLSQMTIWSGKDEPILNALRFSRLDYAANDHDLSLEVLAAMTNGKQQLIKEYVQQKLKSAEPSEVARGIMVTGFSDYNDFNSETLNSYKDSAGLTGLAYAASKYAYERNYWCRHWFEKMCLAYSPADFWCSTILFNKIVDGRFSIWRDEYPQIGMPIIQFGHIAGKRVKHRLEKWKKLRENKFFGSDAPNSIFLEKTT